MKADRQAARQTVAAYHEAQLGALLSRVAEAIDALQRGELDVFEVDQVVFQYSRAAKESWKFCNASDVEFVARSIAERPEMSWWQRGAFRQR